MPDETMSGAAMIAAERRRQIEGEGFTQEHDEEHVDAELSGAAVAYATLARNQIVSSYDPAMASALASGPPSSNLWRWPGDAWKPSTDPIRNLVKAGALIAAEIDRLKRELAVGS